MINIKKALRFNIILLISMVFLYNAGLYSCPISTLRAPIGEAYKDIQTVAQQVEHNRTAKIIGEIQDALQKINSPFPVYLYGRAATNDIPSDVDIIGIDKVISALKKTLKNQRREPIDALSIEKQPSVKESRIDVLAWFIFERRRVVYRITKGDSQVYTDIESLSRALLNDYGYLINNLAIPITFATQGDIRNILGAQKSRYYLVEGHMDIEGWLISGLYSIKRIQRIIEEKNLEPLTPEMVSMLKKFRYSPMVFKDYQSMFKWLQQLARMYEREAYGYIVRKKGKLFISAKLGYQQAADALNRKRQFHTHPSGIADFSDGDIVSFLVLSRQREAIVAGSEGVAIMRKRDVDILKKLQHFIKIAFKEYIKHIVKTTGMVGRDVQFSDIPEGVIPPFYGEAVSFVAQMLSETLTGSPHGIEKLLSYLGIETEVINQDGEHKIIPANIQRNAIDSFLDEFHKNPKLWIQNKVATYIPHNAGTYEEIGIEEAVKELKPAETDYSL